jgi:hypothetical protein
MKSLLFAFGDWMTKIGESKNIRFLIYNPVTWARFLISARRNGKAFALSLKAEYPNVTSCVDIGAGAGGYVKECRRSGIDSSGYEFSSAGRLLALLQSVRLYKFDCSDKQSWPQTKSDMVFTIEVAEHLPIEMADDFVQLVANCSDLIFFTAAQTGQPGQGHINCQPLEYWCQKFEKLGFTHLKKESHQFSITWKEHGFRGFAVRNLQIFQRLGVSKS